MTNLNYGIVDATSPDPPSYQHSEQHQINTTVSRISTFSSRLRQCFSLISVEPTMFFYMFAFMLTTVVEQAFYVNKACTVNHGYSDEICNNLDKPLYQNISVEVQLTVSNFHQWNGIAGHFFPIMLAFFLGAWSDKRGRKVLLLSGLLGNCWWSIMTVVNTMQPTWPVEYMIYTATLPSAFTGTNVAIFAGCFSHLADITTPEDRTLRIGILDVIYLSSMPLGIYIGSVLYTLCNKSFTIMFTINAVFLFIALMHTILNLKWQTSPTQKSMREAGVTNPIKDFFDLKLLRDTVTLFQIRPGHRRLFVWLLLCSMALYTFQRDEKPMLYLYTNKVFGWDVFSFSIFKTYYSTFYVFVMLIGIPLMSKVLKWKDTTIVMIGAFSHAIARIFYSMANNITLMYIGATAASVGPCVAPVIRSMASKAVTPKEKGKMYAILSVCDNAVTLFSATLYTQIYNVSITTNYPYAIFLLTFITQVVVLFFGLVIHLMLRGEPMEKVYLENHEKEELNAENQNM